MTRQIIGVQPSPSPSPSTQRSTLVLVVEDDPSQRASLVAALATRDHRVEAVANGAAALELIKTSAPDIALVDLGLPDVDGIDLCRHLLVQLGCPVIVVTADGLEERVVEALELGADDYVLKPYRTNELLARVGVALRHRVELAPLRRDEFLACGDLEIDIGGHRVRVGGTEVDVLPKPFDLLVALVRNQGRLMTYDTLFRVVWGSDLPIEPTLALRTLISRVRSVVGVGPERPAVETEQRVGYRLVPPA